jgi:hypothetical protein
MTENEDRQGGPSVFSLSDGQREIIFGNYSKNSLTRNLPGLARKSGERIKEN